MTLGYRIEDLQGEDFFVDFQFHKNLDHTLSFQGAWDIVDIRYPNSADIMVSRPWNGSDIEAIHQWLANGGEDLIYIAAQRELR